MNRIYLKKIFAFIVYGLGVISMLCGFTVFFYNLKIILSYDDEKIVSLSFGSGMLFISLFISLGYLISDVSRIVRKFIIKKRLEKNVDKYIERKLG